MIRTLIRVGLALVGSALGLWIASLILDDMRVSGTSFILAVIIFTVLMLVIEPLIRNFAADRSQLLAGASALVATFLALLVTDLVSDGLSIAGAGTWILATAIVWAVTLVAEVILPRLFLKDEPTK